MRIRVNFVRPYEIFYIGHLDMKTLIERGLRRSGLPLKYTEGFNKRVQLELGFPLSVGMVGLDEYFDFFLAEEVSLDIVFEALKNAFNNLLIIKRVKELPYSARSITSFEAVFTNIIYGHLLGNAYCDDLKLAVKEITELKEIVVERDGKIKDIRKFIDNFEVYSCADFQFQLLLTTFYLREGSVKISEIESILNKKVSVEFEYTERKSTLVFDKGRLVSPFDLVI